MCTFLLCKHGMVVANARCVPLLHNETNKKSSVTRCNMVSYSPFHPKFFLSHSSSNNILYTHITIILNTPSYTFLCVHILVPKPKSTKKFFLKNLRKSLTGGHFHGKLNVRKAVRMGKDLKNNDLELVKLTEDDLDRIIDGQVMQAEASRQWLFLNGFCYNGIDRPLTLPASSRERIKKVFLE